jgi:alanyl-tRNA synthetase
MLAVQLYKHFNITQQVYPDPVRVISFGVSVENLEKNPDGEEGVETSVEFCGGTHLHQSGHIVDFIITSEEAIAKGVRRIVALTGPEADKARKKTALLENELNKLKARIEAAGDNVSVKEETKEIVALNEDISQATISYVKKDEMRQVLNGIKKILGDKDRAKKAAVTNVVLEEAKQLAEQNKDVKFFVHRFDAFNNTKALDGALKQVQKVNPEASALFVTVDDDSKKIFCLAIASKSGIEKGLKANEWVQYVQPLMNGKGGGKAESAQASGSSYEKADEIIELAKTFALSKLE